MDSAQNLDSDGDELDGASEADLERNSPQSEGVSVRTRSNDELRRIPGSPKEVIWQKRAEAALKIAGIIGGSLLLAILLAAAITGCGGALMFLIVAGLGIYGAAHFGKIWWNRGAHLDCPYCGRKVSSTLTWVCGKCGHTNTPSLFQTVFEQCGKCSEIPRSYVCHHSDCSGIILMTNDMDDEHPAYASGSAAPPQRSRRSNAGLKDDWQTEREELEHKVNMATLGTTLLSKNIEAEKIKHELDRVKKPPLQSDPVKAEVERMLRSLATQDEKEKALRQYAKDQKKKVKAEKLDPDEEKRRLEELSERIAQARAKYL